MWYAQLMVPFGLIQKGLVIVRELAIYLAKLMLIGSIIGAIVGFISTEGLPEGVTGGAFTGAMIGLSIVALRSENRRITWKYRRRRYQADADANVTQSSPYHAASGFTGDDYSQ